MVVHHNFWDFLAKRDDSGLGRFEDELDGAFDVCLAGVIFSIKFAALSSSWRKEQDTSRYSNIEISEKDCGIFSARKACRFWRPSVIRIWTWKCQKWSLFPFNPILRILKYKSGFPEIFFSICANRFSKDWKRSWLLCRCALYWARTISRFANATLIAWTISLCSLMCFRHLRIH